MTHPVDRTVTFESTCATPGEATEASSRHTKVNRDDYGITWNVALEAGGRWSRRTSRSKSSSRPSSRATSSRLTVLAVAGPPVAIEFSGRLRLVLCGRYRLIQVPGMRRRLGGHRTP